AMPVKLAFNRMKLTTLLCIPMALVYAISRVSSAIAGHKADNKTRLLVITHRQQ
ncbi:MAG: hypothetical protein ACI965_000929, partial [Paraglaciecola sp.]